MLQFLINDSPTAKLVLRCLGAVWASCFTATLVVLPKLYHLASEGDFAGSVGEKVNARWMHGASDGRCTASAESFDPLNRRSLFVRANSGLARLNTIYKSRRSSAAARALRYSSASERASARGSTRSSCHGSNPGTPRELGSPLGTPREHASNPGTPRVFHVRALPKPPEARPPETTPSEVQIAVEIAVDASRPGGSSSSLLPDANLPAGACACAGVAGEEACVAPARAVEAQEPLAPARMRVDLLALPSERQSTVCFSDASDEAAVAAGAPQAQQSPAGAGAGSAGRGVLVTPRSRRSSGADL